MSRKEEETQRNLTGLCSCLPAAKQVLGTSYNPSFFFLRAKKGSREDQDPFATWPACRQTGSFAPLREQKKMSLSAAVDWTILLLFDLLRSVELKNGFQFRTI